MTSEHHPHILPKKAPHMFGATNKGDIVRCLYDGDYRKYYGQQVEYLGSGRFTTAFRLRTSGHVLLFTFYEDWSKAILAGCTVTDKSPHLPKVYEVAPHWVYKRHGREFICSVYTGEYVCPYLRMPLKYNKAKLRKQAHCLQEIHEKAQDDFPRYLNMSKTYCDNFNEHIIQMCNENVNVPTSITLALMTLREEALSWQSYYAFDNFTENNLGIKDDQLVLLDPMFNADRLVKDYEARMKARRDKR